ncbi:hypothetical protein HDE_11627 [Halotydeus destructor]|nr:hypothetical protein HDE_11627 [Halotydeus destructor]
MSRSVELKQLLIELNGFMSTQQRSKVRNYSQAIQAMYFTIGFLVLAYYCVMLQYAPDNDIYRKRDILYEWVYSVFSVISPTLFGFAWIPVGLTTYCLIVTSWSFANSRINRFAISQGQLDDEKCLTLVYAKRNIVYLKARIDQLIGAIPLLVIAPLFIESTGLVVSRNNRQFNDLFSSLNLCSLRVQHHDGSDDRHVCVIC